MPDRTPGFLAWSLQRQCELREFDGWDDPLQIERALRPVRAIRKAQLESRIDGDICIQPFSELESIQITDCLLYTSPSPRDGLLSRMPSSA